MKFTILVSEHHPQKFYLTHRTLSGATTLGLSGPGSNGNEGVLHIPQSSHITGTSPSDCLMSYPGHFFCGGGGSYPSAEMQLVYSTATADWTTINKTLKGTPNPGQSGPESNGNEEVLHIPQSSKTEPSPLGCFVSYPGHSLGGRSYPLCRDAVGVFYSPSQLGWYCFFSQNYGNCQNIFCGSSRGWDSKAL